MKYVVVICRVIANAMYLLYLLIAWLCVRVVRRFKVHERQQARMSEARAEKVCADNFSGRRSKASKTHVARHSDLAAVASRTSADERDGCDWQPDQTN